MIHFGGKSKVAASKSMSSDTAPGIELSQIECSAAGEPKTIFSKKFIESPTKDEKMFYHNKRVILYKTEMCRSFNEMGFCKYGDRCQFCHSKEELREVQRHPKYKTEICKTFWNDGSCPYGSRCCFVHLESLELVSRAMSDHSRDAGQVWGHREERKSSRCPMQAEEGVHRADSRVMGCGQASPARRGSAEYRRLLLGAVRKARKDGLFHARAPAERDCPDKGGDVPGDFDTIEIATAEESSTSTTKACYNPCAGTLSNRASALCSGAAQGMAADMQIDKACTAAHTPEHLRMPYSKHRRSAPIEYKIECMPGAVDILSLPRKSIVGYLYGSTIEALIEARSFESDTLAPKMLPRLMMLEEIHFKGYQSVWERNYIARWKNDPIFFILQDIKDND